jgi:hypothetical protein
VRGVLAQVSAVLPVSRRAPGEKNFDSKRVSPRNKPSHFTGVAAYCFRCNAHHSLNSPLCSYVAITLPALSHYAATLRVIRSPSFLHGNDLAVVLRQRLNVPILTSRTFIDNLEVVIFDDLRTVAHFQRDLSLVLGLLHAIAAE